ncbi:hypothetical protein IC220_06090 [Wolbachia endosymbiont of Pentalonia nigronervosa]|jgi:hypothetical protein|uniref:hypothetical protein n=1 Tax=Wolbachia endosymbiont of Pentalonia nigronervosa TaxID=1301914 RepID=UPI00165F0F37|nr:hypothetical protein [Wolbachia endosymbiont of Pentalonia nigronervosa]
MRLKKVSRLEDEEFRRLTGVKRSIFGRMTEILIEEEVKKKARGGKPNKLSMEDRLLRCMVPAYPL